MEVITRNRPSFANVLVKLKPGEKIIAEADAMASMSASVEIRTRWNGGIFKAILKRVFGGESMFVNEFSSDQPAEVVITQGLPGDIECIELKGTTLYLQPGAYIASEPGVNLGIGWAGFKSFIGGEGLFRLKISGTGRCWFGAYGGIFEREVTDEYIVDTGHLVAYEPTIHLRVGLAGGIFSSFFGGEGLITRVRGTGKIYLQSRNYSGLTAWVNAHI
ncbi:MAG: hypothetical protein JWM11_3875 [Planctomycetaceae bacterium]|nr:hypothetical protein [Planctomycetaceae bacterium]